MIKNGNRKKKQIKYINGINLFLMATSEIHLASLMGIYKKNISSQSDEITNDIISGKVGDIETGRAAAIALYARYLKRIAAHSRNLISSVVNPFERIGYPEK